MTKRNTQERAEYNQQIGMRLRAVRECLGFNQRAFCSAIGVAQNTYHKWEAGANAADPYVLLVIWQNFKVPLGFLYAGDHAGWEKPELAVRVAQWLDARYPRKHDQAIHMMSRAFRPVKRERPFAAGGGPDTK